MKSQNPINPVFNLEFESLYNREGLLKIDEHFLQFLQDYCTLQNSDLYKQYLALRNNPKYFDDKEQSYLLIEVGKILEDFLTLFFNIRIANQELQKEHQKLANFHIAGRFFVERRVAKKFKEFPSNWGHEDLAFLKNYPSSNGFITDDELLLANKIGTYLQNEDLYQEELQEIEKYCVWALFHEDGKLRHQDGILFKLPKKIDFYNLVELETAADGSKKSPQHLLSNRDGFKLTDKGYNLAKALNEANYCIYCHNQGKDSCKVGLREKVKEKTGEKSEEKDWQFKKDPFGTELSGCPLEEKISEMNLLKSEGKSIAALAMAVVDNPMIAGTGHRICNDCMKSCIYQKQEPVDIPQVETRTLKDVLSLPFGFEIYSLLTRWNPLNLERVIEKEPSGYKVMVAGLGPSGYTLAHHLLNEGHLVVAVDGLKIEPLDPAISGIDLHGKRSKFEPIKDIQTIYEELDERSIGGFGGVAEYGITVRWNKNFLKIIRLLLERRHHFRMFGGFRLGSGLDCYDALKEYDFDHVALCLGAGWVKIPEIKNNLLKGIRMASDFLMALQLTGAERKNLLSNLQVRLPIVVVGAGLTAMDTACEALAYYPKQVENFANKYQILCQKIGKDVVEKSWNEEDKSIAVEFLGHHQLILQAKKNNENIPQLLQKLGGATIIYRKKLQDSPAYRLNHEEVEKAFAESIEFLENVTPLEAVSDKFGHIKTLKINHLDREIDISAKALFLAAGTTPNKAPFYEDKLKFALDGSTFQIIDLLGEKLPAITSPKSASDQFGKGVGFVCAKNDQGKAVSFFGDLHPSFNGSVVKAMASAKNGYPIINQFLQKLDKESSENRARGVHMHYSDFLQKISNDFAVKVQEINVLSNYFIELVVYAPLLSQKTKLGHIFRLHNYHSLAVKNDVDVIVKPSSLLRGEGSWASDIENGAKGMHSHNFTLLAMEGVAVTTYKVDPVKGTITVMLVDAGGSSSMVKNLKVDEPIIFMGPSGTPSHILKNQTVLLIAGGRGIFPLAGLAAEYKKNNCRVILCCGFNNADDLVRQAELEISCDYLVLAIKNNAINIKSNRQNDFVFEGDAVAAVVEYFKKNNPHQKIDAVLTMGSDAMMHKVAQAYHQDLKEHLSDSAIGITSLNSPMQCMLKGVCSQCLQRKIDSKTGQEKFFYACLSPEQKMSEIDFEFLKNRCEQNSLAEKITKSWMSILS